MELTKVLLMKTRQFLLIMLKNLYFSIYLLSLYQRNIAAKLLNQKISFLMPSYQIQFIKLKGKKILIFKKK